MTQEEIIARLIDLLDLHFQGGFGSIYQVPTRTISSIIHASLQKARL
jgi:hypothetical protein